MKAIIVLILLASAVLFPFNCTAEKQPIGITTDKPYAVLNDGNSLIRIQRLQDINQHAGYEDTGPSSGCPPFCVSPLRIADGVETMAELEVIEFMETSYLSGEGLIVDVRGADSYAQATIPGSINIPFTAFEQTAGDRDLRHALQRLGASERGEVTTLVRALEKLGLFDGAYKTDAWDFTGSRDVLLWCDDAQCEESPRAIRALVRLGYPPEKLFYYRGGMQMWQSLGLTTVTPADRSTFASK